MNRLQQSRRQTFGYVYEPQVQNNVIIPTRYRNNYDVMEQSFDQSSQSVNDMGGEGIMDLVRGIMSKGKEGAQYAWENRDKIKKAGEMASDLYASDIGKAVQNILPSSDETARPGYAGEKHAILQLPNGKYGVANYMGPGTEVMKRLKRGDPPRTLSDKTAMRHDIDYAIAAGAKDKDIQNKMIREADKRMVKNLNRIAKNKSDAKKNIFQGRRLIQGKMAAEDAGLMKKGSFGGPLSKISSDDMAILKSNRDKLGQEGYGMLPAQALKLKLLKQHRRSKKGKKGKGLKLSGGGLHPTGGGLNIPGGMMKKINKICSIEAKKGMKGKGIVDIVKSVVKVLSPVVKEVGKKAFKEVVIPYAVEKIKEKMSGKKGEGICFSIPKKTRVKKYEIKAPEKRPFVSGEDFSKKKEQSVSRRNPVSRQNSISSLSVKFDDMPGYMGDGLKLAGQRGKGMSMGKSYGTSKGYPMKGGFWFLAPLIGLAAEAISGITVASVGSAVASGAASAVAASVTKKLLGKGMKGKGIKEVSQKVGQVLKKNKAKIIKVAEATGVTQKDLPKKILDKAQAALDVINEISSGKPSKEKVLGVVKMLIPHIKEVFHAKMKKKLKGSGMLMAGQGKGFDTKVLSVIKKNL